MKQFPELLILFFSLVLVSFDCPGQSISWYKSYAGAIDKYPVTMHLYKTGHDYTGYYYYNSRQQPVYFTGEDTSAAGKIKLYAYIPDKDADEGFEFSIKEKKASGKWHTAKDKALSFSANESSAGLAFDYIYTEGVTPLRPKVQGSPSANFVAASIWPKGNSPQVIFLKKLIREAFGEKNSTDDIGQLLLKQKKLFFTNYTEENYDVKDEDLKDAYYLNRDETVRMMIVYRSSKLLVFAQSAYSYTGGAHGNYGTSYIGVDLVNNKKLTLNNIVTKPGEEKLDKLLEKYFRKAYKVNDGDPLTEGGLFENKIEPNNNFYVTAKGIGFCYTPYEIGPYAMGKINIFIPFTELNTYLQPGFRKLLLP